MRSDIDGDLDRAGEIQADDVLQVRVGLQLFDGCRPLFLDSVHTASKRFQLFGNYGLVHAARLCLRIRLRYGRKSAASNRCFDTSAAQAAFVPVRRFPCCRILPSSGSPTVARSIRSIGRSVNGPSASTAISRSLSDVWLPPVTEPNTIDSRMSS